MISFWGHSPRLNDVAYSIFAMTKGITNCVPFSKTRPRTHKLCRGAVTLPRICLSPASLSISWLSNKQFVCKRGVIKFETRSCIGRHRSTALLNSWYLLDLHDGLG